MRSMGNQAGRVEPLRLDPPRSLHEGTPLESKHLPNPIPRREATTARISRLQLLLPVGGDDKTRHSGSASGR